jgi:hypothetical protein
MSITSLNKRDSALPTAPVRRIPLNRRSVTSFVSFRGEHSIQCESTLERDFVMLQEFSLPVLDVVSQPCEIPFVGSNGRRYTYTPDFLVYYKTDSAPDEMLTKPLLVEVKPEEQWRKHWREWLPKWKAAHRYASDRGWRFKIMDESRIRSTPLENINFLKRYVDLDCEETYSQEVLADLEALGSATFEYLLVKHFQGLFQAQGIQHLWHLLVTRRIECDITLPLGNDTELWVPYDV